MRANDVMRAIETKGHPPYAVVLTTLSTTRAELVAWEFRAYHSPA